MTPYIRPARGGDLKAIEYICRMTAGEASRTNAKIGNITAKMYSAYYVRECLDTCFCLADDTDTAVGYILCEPDFKRFSRLYIKKDVPAIFKLEKKSGIEALFFPVPYIIFGRKYPAHLHIDILPEYQNSGFGSKMVEALFNTLRERRVRGVMLITGAENTGAIRFYGRLGFKTLIAATGVIMAKEL